MSKYLVGKEEILKILEDCAFTCEDERLALIGKQDFNRVAEKIANYVNTAYVQRLVSFLKEIQDRFVTQKDETFTR